MYHLYGPFRQLIALCLPLCCNSMSILYNCDHVICHLGSLLMASVLARICTAAKAVMLHLLLPGNHHWRLSSQGVGSMPA